MVYTVCIGSNEHPQANLAFARRRLSECFPGIRFSKEEETEFCLLSLIARRNKIDSFYNISNKDNIFTGIFNYNSRIWTFCSSKIVQGESK